MTFNFGQIQHLLITEILHIWYKFYLLYAFQRRLPSFLMLFDRLALTFGDATIHRSSKVASLFSNPILLLILVPTTLETPQRCELNDTVIHLLILLLLFLISIENVSLFPAAAILWVRSFCACACVGHYAPEYAVAAHHTILQSRVNVVNLATTHSAAILWIPLHHTHGLYSFWNHDLRKRTGGWNE